MFGPTFTSPQDKMHGGNKKEPSPLPRMIKHTKGKHYKYSETGNIYTRNTAVYEIVENNGQVTNKTGFVYNNGDE